MMADVLHEGSGGPVDKAKKTSQAERMAAKLRENLHRRKDQARARSGLEPKVQREQTRRPDDTPEPKNDA